MVTAQFSGPYGLPTAFTIGPIHFYMYGLILGIAGVVFYTLSSNYAKRLGIAKSLLNPYVYGGVLGGVIGARIWHVITDWNLYRSQFSAVLHIWEGGASILGGIVGMLVGISVIHRCLRYFGKNTIPLFLVFDLIAIGLPFAQAIGRFANFINQELYGAPSNLPWAIHIAERQRVTGYKDVSYFHPLFAYEGIAMMGFGLFIWLHVRGISKKIGDGTVFYFYLVYYSLLRFLLDFLRIDVRRVALGMSINQLVLFASIVFLVSFGVFNVYLKKRHESNKNR